MQWKLPSGYIILNPELDHSCVHERCGVDPRCRQRNCQRMRTCYQFVTYSSRRLGISKPMYEIYRSLWLMPSSDIPHGPKEHLYEWSGVRELAARPCSQTLFDASVWGGLRPFQTFTLQSSWTGAYIKTDVLQMDLNCVTLFHRHRRNLYRHLLHAQQAEMLCVLRLVRWDSRLSHKLSWFSPRNISQRGSVMAIWWAV